MNNDNFAGKGYMIVRVTTARGAIPLEGALVTVSSYGDVEEGGRGDVIASRMTDRSGVTERIALSAPPRALSMSPGNGKSYQSYNVSVSKDGFFSQNYINAPVFEGITSIQSADMIPLPDNGQSDSFTPYGNIFFESENPSLEIKEKEED